jgi:hypothetical protein
MKPTKEQLADPKWWDEQVFSQYKFCYWNEEGRYVHFTVSLIPEEELLAKRPEPEWVPVLGSVCEIAASTEYLKISHKEGLKVKIYSRFIDDRGVTLFAFVAIDGKSGGVVTAECLRPKKTQREELIEIILMNSEAELDAAAATASIILGKYDLTEKDDN